MLRRIFLIALVACAILPLSGSIVGASEGAPSAAASPCPSAMATGVALPSATPSVTADAYDVELYVFLYDKCGGCGSNDPGCGNCQDTIRYHGIIKGQLGNRLYDGTILYRVKNLRMNINHDLYETYSAAYGIPKELQGQLPAVFIGTLDHGIYLLDEPMLDYVGQYLDRYLAGEDPALLQQEIDAIHLQFYPELTPVPTVAPTIAPAQ